MRVGLGHACALAIYFLPTLSSLFILYIHIQIRVKIQFKNFQYSSIALFDFQTAMLYELLKPKLCIKFTFYFKSVNSEFLNVYRYSRLRLMLTDIAQPD